MSSINKKYCQYKNCYKPALYVYRDRPYDINEPFICYRHALTATDISLMVKEPICENRQCTNIATHMKRENDIIPRLCIEHVPKKK